MTAPNDPPLRAAEIGRRVPVGALSRDDFTYSVVETSGPSQKARRDRRGEERMRSRLREGQVAEGRGKVLVECRIRDLSKRGARLRLDKDRPLPKAFFLTEAGSRRSFWATLAWQVGRDAGVKLTPIA